MAIKNAINRIKSKAYGYSSDKTSASERIKARATGIGEHSYYTIDKWQKDHQSSLDAINKYSQVMNSGGWMSADDLSKYKSAIDTYTSTGNSLRGLGKYTADEDKSWLDSINSLNSGYNDASSFYNQFADENEYGTWWNYNTKKNDYTSVTGAEDYKQNSQYVKDIQDNRYNFINKSKGNSFALPGINYGNAKDWTLLPDAFKSWNEGELELTDEEIGVYNYYYATQGKKKAEEYLDFIAEEIKQRKAGIDYKNFKTLDKAFDTLLNVDTGNLGEYAYGFGAGVESGVAGIANIGALIAGTEGYTPSSQYTSAMIRNDLGGDNGELTLQQVFYDLANTTGNMAPSLLAGGAAGAGVGALTMGLSSAGNNYTALLKEGYGENAARAFGIMTGVAEAGMSYAFSGISKLGGKLTQNAVGKMVSGVNNALARTAIQVGGSLAGEAIEEATQTALEPVFKWAATLGEAEFEAASWEDIAYSALLGAMSAGLLEGAPTVAGTAIQSHQAFTGAGGATLGGIINAAVDPDVDFAGYVTNGAENVTNKAVEYANELESIDPGNKAAQYVRKRAEAGKNVSGYQINRLADEINSNNRDTVKGAIKARLDELGEKGNTEKLADVLTKVRLGEALSASEEIALNTSKNAYLVLTESDTSNVRGGGVANKWANSIVDRIDGTKSNTVKNATAGKQDEKEIKQVAKGLTDTKGFTEEATNAMVKGYDGNMPADDYSTLYQAAYDAGASGKAQSVLSSLINLGLSQQTAFTAYEIGKNSVLKSDIESGIINTENAEAKNESGEGVHLRGSVQRSDGKNTEGQVSRVESDSGETEGRRNRSRGPADGEAARLVNEGREVSVADLGVPGGVKDRKVYRLEEVEETASMKKARAAAEKRGLVVRFFAGDNLMLEGKDGRIENVRGYIQGKYVYVRADHPMYTADQIMRHELGHDMIAKGEVAVKKVIDRLKELVGEENVETVAEFYAKAYAGTGLTVYEVWEEVICDSLGDMNVFSGDDAISKFIAPMLKDIKQAAQETKGEANKTRGTPEGKASSEVIELSKDNELSALVEGIYGAEKYKKIARYIQDVLGDQEIVLSDGRIAVVDKSDAMHIANKSATKKTAQISKIKEIVQAAKMYAEDKNADHPKFNEFYYYKAQVKFDAEEFPIYLNVGRAKNNGVNHIYDITNKIRDTADRINGLERPKPNEGYALTNGISTYSIPQKTNLSSSFDKNISEGKFSREFSSPEEAKMSGEVSDAKFSIEFADDIADKQRKYEADGLSMISAEELDKAIEKTARMVNLMKPFAKILPQDKIGKTLVKNGSYDISVENTTICIRTLAYNSFVDMVSEKVGRPLTQMESFLVSQKLYEIAKEPQCLYCYVSLDRKAFNEMVIRYTQQRDEAIKAYEAAGKPKVPSSFNAEWKLFKEFLDGRKPTKNMWDRYVGWINAYNKGERMVSLADISTEAKRLELVEAGGEMASQVKDMLKYAQSASWAKKQTQYVAYYDEILKLKPAVIRNLNSHYGMRWYSFSDYSGAFIVENMQQITDAAIRGLKGLSYTKDTDFAEIFAPTGMNINISVYAKKNGRGGYEIDAKQSANIDEAIKLREKYPNVGIVVVATDAAGVEWALEQEWSDVVIPFHTVRTGADVAEFYNWEIFNAEQSDTVSDQNLWDAYVNSVGKNKASKMVYPSEHQNNRETYLRICEERGLTPRFKSFLNNPNYMKLVNETRQSEGQTKPLKADFNLEAAERSFDKFVEKGGYYEGWYNDGIDVDNEADIVASDVRAGKKANEVDYGRQDVDFEAVKAGRKENRTHGRASRELDLIDYINEKGEGEVRAEDKPLTNREILANALESATQSQEELERLKEYKKNIKELNKKAYVLSKLKEDIKRLSFAKGQKDMAKIAELKEKAGKIDRSINYYDRQLTKLEAMKPIKDLVQRERQQACKVAAEKGREALKRNVEGRHKSEARAKIKGLKEKFMSMLEHPTERQYVPSDLVSAMVKVCEMIDTSTSLLKSDGSINKAQQARNEQMQRLINLAAEYKNIKNNPDAMIAEEYEVEIADYLDEIVANYASKNIADMTLDELNELYRTMKAIEETLRDARKLIGWTDAESVYDAGDSIIEEQRGIAATRKQNGITRADDVVVNMSLSPMRAVLRMGGYNEDSALYRAMRYIERGIREQKKFVMDAVKKFEALTTGKNADVYEKAIYDPYGKELIDKNGKKFHVTKMQMMQAVMSYERELANEKLHHVSNGGFTFADIDLLGKGEIREAVSAKNAHTVTLGAELALKFQMELANDQWAQDYMAEARKFFDETAKDAINEANMKLKHRIIATGKNYIPYEVNSDYIVREITSENDIQQVISGYGMLKDLKAGATQPIIITGLNNVLDRHIEQVGNVAALAVPIRNFNKIWNVKAADGSTTVKEAISNNWGTRGTDLITQAVKDVQGSRIQDRSDLYKAYKVVKSNIIGGTFLGNVSVVMKQIGSMYTATSMLGWRNPVSMIGNLFETKANRDAIAAEVNKYTGVAWVRGQGLSDAELYELKTAKKKSKIGRAVDKLPNALKATSWITQMDYDVALSLWKYAKEDVAKRTGLEGEELLQATAEYYNDVIENTQSMSDALHRPEIQKSDNIASETLGIFKTDLYQSAGLLRVAVENVKANPGKESNKALVKALGGTFMSMCWGALINSLMAALRYKPDRYRDDEDDEITLGSWLKVAAGDMAEEMFGYAFPLFGSEAAGIISAFINGESYEFDNLTLDAVNGLLKAFTSVGATFNEEDFFSEKAGKAWKNLLIKVAAVFGVPANNVTRFIDAVRLHAQDIANGEFLSFEAGLTSPNKTRLYNAYLEGDADKIEKASRLYEDKEIVDPEKRHQDKEKAIASALKSAMRENDPRVKEAALARLDGDEDKYWDIMLDVIEEAKFDMTLIKEAFEAEYNYHKDKKKDAEERGKTYP